MEHQLTLEPCGDRWKVISALCNRGKVAMAQAEIPEAPMSLQELLEQYPGIRVHWRFEHGLLFVGTSDVVYDVVGVPHCGNRFTCELLNGAGYPAEIHHLGRPDVQYDQVLPVRDPRSCLLSHWKRQEIDEGYLNQFLAMWGRAAELGKEATVFHVDRETPADLFRKLEIDKTPPPAEKHAHPLIDVKMTNVPAEVDAIAKEWGYL